MSDFILMLASWFVAQTLFVLLLSVNMDAKRLQLYAELVEYLLHKVKMYFINLHKMQLFTHSESMKCFLSFILSSVIHELFL